MSVRLTDRANDSDGHPSRADGVERIEVAVPVRRYIERRVGEHERLCCLEHVDGDHKAFKGEDVGWEGEVVEI